MTLRTHLILQHLFHMGFLFCFIDRGSNVAQASLLSARIMGMHHHMTIVPHFYFPDEETETQRVKDLPRVKPSQLWTAVIVSRILP